MQSAAPTWNDHATSIPAAYTTNLNQSKPPINNPQSLTNDRPTRTAHLSQPQTPIHPAQISQETAKPPMAVPQGVGFFSAKAVAILPEGQAADGAPMDQSEASAFNPHAESPSIRKTPGVNHNTSKPLGRDLKHVASKATTETADVPGPKSNVVNPQLSTARRIGAPGGASPMANRTMYKPPTIKRPHDPNGDGNGNAPASNRPPLVDLQSNGVIAHANDQHHDLKRQRMSN